jgi:hypothetical protein
MIIIAHRGNLIGPNSKHENTQFIAQKAIDLHFDVELDLWETDNDDWWFGHDCPESIIPKSFILEHKNHIWIHAKTGQTLQLALDNKLKCFYHNVDDFTLTSNGCIWRYPRNDLPISRDTVVVLPETNCNNQIPHSNLETMLHEARAVCTDYPILLRTAFSTIHPNDIWLQGLELESVYNEIANRTITEFRYDSFATDDLRRCVAVFSDYELDKQFDSIANYLKSECGEQCIYTLEKSSQNNRGTLHFTWMQLSDFEYCSKNGISLETLKNFENIVQNNNVYTYFQFIVFHKVLLLPNCIILVGYPSWNILKWRQYIRDQHYEHFHEPHSQNIVHSTLVRFTQPMANPSKIVADIQKMLPLKLLLKPKQVSKCSWTMGSEIERNME